MAYFKGILVETGASRLKCFICLKVIGSRTIMTLPDTKSLSAPLALFCWQPYNRNTIEQSQHDCSLFSKQTVVRLDPVDTWGRPWMMRSILRVTGTYMVIKILSMDIPFSLNTALSGSPPSFQRFQVHFFCALCPAQWLSHLQLCTPAGEHDWPKVRRLWKRGCHWPKGRYVRIGARLLLDRTPGPAIYAQSEITRTSEQPVEEGGQKEEGEKKKIEKVTEVEKEREEASAVV